MMDVKQKFPAQFVLILSALVFLGVVLFSGKSQAAIITSQLVDGSGTKTFSFGGGGGNYHDVYTFNAENSISTSTPLTIWAKIANDNAYCGSQISIFLAKADNYLNSVAWWDVITPGCVDPVVYNYTVDSNKTIIAGESLKLWIYVNVSGAGAKASFDNSLTNLFGAIYSESTASDTSNPNNDNANSIVISYPTTDVEGIYLLHSGEYVFNFKITSGYDDSIFMLWRSYTDHSFSSSTASSTWQTWMFPLSKGNHQFGQNISVKDGEAVYYMAQIWNPSNDFALWPFGSNKDYMFDVIGDDTLTAIPTENFPDRYHIEEIDDYIITCPIPYLKWDPCRVVDTIKNNVKNGVNDIASTTINGVISTKPYSYAFEAYSAIQTGTEAATGTLPVVKIVVPTTTAFLNQPRMDFNPIPSDLFTRLIPQAQWDSIRVWAVLGLYVTLGWWIIRKFMAIV